MPTFTAGVSDLEQIGPVVDLSLAVPRAAEDAMKKAGETVPSPINVAMMIDTGASVSVVKPDVAQRLGLHAVGVSPVLGVTTVKPAMLDVYAVRLLLPAGVIAEVNAVGAELNGQQSIQGLIGRDLLKFGVLIYNGDENQFTLSF